MWGVCRACVAVGADVVGAQGVDGDDEDVRLGTARADGQRRQLGLRRVRAPRPPPGAAAASAAAPRSASAVSAVRSWAA